MMNKATCVLALSMALPSVAAQTSEMFICAGDNLLLSVVQGGSLLRSWSVTSLEFSIAVLNGRVRTVGNFPAAPGRVYDLTGGIIGPPHAHSLPGIYYDSTTDGTYLYVVRQDGPGSVYRTDLTYQNGQLLFTASGSNIGITYDPTDDTLWISEWSPGTLIKHYTMGGTLLGSFSTGHQLNTALALDHADGTLWIHDRNIQGVFEQWTKGGVMLYRGPVGITAQNVHGAEFEFRPRAVMIHTITATALQVAPGQSGLVVSFDAENITANLQQVNSLGLTFRDGALVDRTSEYVVVPDPGNPTSITALGSGVFTFAVDVTALATLGTITIDGTIEVTDATTMQPSTDDAADTPDSWDVIGAVPLVRTVAATPARVAPGTTGHAVTVTVENVGLDAVDVNQVALVFRDAGMIDVSAGYTVVPDPGNPTAIASGATEIFTFAVGVSTMVTTGVVTLDARIDATDQVSMAMVSDSGADTPDSWDVVTAEPRVRVVDATPDTVSPGGSGYQVMVSVENVGLVTAFVTGVSLTFDGTVDRSAEYIVAALPGNPTSVAPTVTANFGFSVSVAPAASFETITLDAGFAGVDAVLGALVVDVDADTTDAWDVVMCAAPVCGDCNGDLQITILDALRAAQHGAGLITLVGSEFTGCNVSGALEPSPAAAVSILDALAIAQQAAGLAVALVCC